MKKSNAFADFLLDTCLPILIALVMGVCITLALVFGTNCSLKTNVQSSQNGSNQTVVGDTNAGNNSNSESGSQTSGGDQNTGNNGGSQTGSGNGSQTGSGSGEGTGGTDGGDLGESGGDSGSQTGGSGGEGGGQTQPPAVEVETLGLEYTLSSDETYYICSGIGTETKTDIVIASTYKDKPVKEIGSGAFNNCDSLTSVTIGENVESIGNYSFAHCYSLTSVTIGENVESIGGGAFYGCSKLTSITVDEGNTAYKSIDGNLYTKDGTTLIQYAIGKTATSFVIPESVTSIGNYAFYGCDSLTSVTIGENVKSIGDRAFSGCSKLTSVTIPSSVTSIGSGAFEGCRSLTSIVIPDKVTSIGSRAFYGCNSLKNIIVDESNTAYKSIDGNLYTKDGTTLIQYAIGKTATSFVIPNSVTSIGDSAFYGCSKLTYTEYENGLYIGNASNPYLVLVKAKDTSITSCTINSNCKFIHSSAFYSCDSLTSVTIGESVTSIGSSAFSNCTALTEIKFNATDMNDLSEDNDVFYNAGQNGEGIKVTIGKNVTKIPADLFCLANYITSVEFEEGSVCTSIGASAFYECSKLTRVEYNGDINSWAMIEFGSSTANPVYCAEHLYINGVDYYTISEITLDTATKIGSYAFDGFENLTKITIGNQVQSIGSFAFRNCTKLTSVTIGNSVQSIGEDAFYECDSLTSVTIGENVTSIGYSAFSSCSRLTRVDYTGDINSWAMIEFGNWFANPLYYANHLYINGEEVTEVVLDTATKVSDYAFKSATSITKVTIGNQVQSIGDYAFYDCSKLTSVTFEDASTWYYTSTSNHNYTGGTQIDVTDTSTNATYLRSTHYNKYWYKV